MSARHQAKRLDRIFEGFALLENRSGRRNKFSSFGADLRGPQFHRRSKAQVKSGPDVFADALVSSAAAADPGALISQNFHTSTFSTFTREAVKTRFVVSWTRCSVLPAMRSIVRYAAPQSRTHTCIVQPMDPGSAAHHAASAARRAASGARDRSDGYRFAKRQGKPNSAGKRKPL